MMENLCLVAALAQRPAKGGQAVGKANQGLRNPKDEGGRAAARKGEQIRKTRLPIIDTVDTSSLSLARSSLHYTWACSPSP